MRRMREGTVSWGKSRWALAGILFLLAAGMLTGCGKEQTYEGGNMKFRYDPDKWTLECCTTEEYPVLELNGETVGITFMALESDDSVVQGFRESMIGLMVMFDDTMKVEEMETWNEGSVKCYMDFISGDTEEDNVIMISCGKTEGEWLILVLVEYLPRESDDENEAVRQEAMKIIESMTISQKAEVVGAQENENLIYFYNLVSDLQKYGHYSELSDAEGEPDQTEEGKVSGTGELISDEEAASLQYVEKFMVEDYYGDKEEYPAYAPVGSDYSNGFLGYFDHGISFGASVYDGGADVFMYQYFEMSVEIQVEYWEESEDYTDIQIGEVQANGGDRYQLVTARTQDYQGTPYVVKTVYYLDAQGDGVCILWNMELSESSIDGETNLILDEMAQCYGISLDEMKTGGEWHRETQKKEELRQDEYEPEEGSLALTKVEGYQYMGMTTLISYDGGAQCPAMAPMGRRTSVYENHIYSSMHGVSTSTTLNKLVFQDYLSSVKIAVDGEYDYLLGKDGVRNVWRSEMITMPEYEQASYAVITYEEQDYMDEKYVPQVEVQCFIRINEDYVLVNKITLNYGEYDDSTNALLKELETAYGIDVSRYYYEK